MFVTVEGQHLEHLCIKYFQICLQNKIFPALLFALMYINKIYHDIFIIQWRSNIYFLKFITFVFCSCFVCIYYISQSGVSTISSELPCIWSLKVASDERLTCICLYYYYNINIDILVASEAKGLEVVAVPPVLVINQIFEIVRSIV